MNGSSISALTPGQERQGRVEKRYTVCGPLSELNYAPFWRNGPDGHSRRDLGDGQLAGKERGPTLGVHVALVERFCVRSPDTDEIAQKHR